jgi:3-hydroxyacyl-CoA dehydrogenase
MCEALYWVESGHTTIEDVDRCLQNDPGYWITFAGPSRLMDLTGVPAYKRVTEELLPELCCSKQVRARGEAFPEIHLRNSRAGPEISGGGRRHAVEG